MAWSDDFERSSIGGDWTCPTAGWWAIQSGAAVTPNNPDGSGPWHFLYRAVEHYTGDAYIEATVDDFFWPRSWSGDDFAHEAKLALYLHVDTTAGDAFEQLLLVAQRDAVTDVSNWQVSLASRPGGDASYTSGSFDGPSNASANVRLESTAGALLGYLNGDLVVELASSLPPCVYGLTAVQLLYFWYPATDADAIDAGVAVNPTYMPRVLSVSGDGVDCVPEPPVTGVGWSLG